MISIEVVCSPKEERAILEYILAGGDVVPLLPIPSHPKRPPIVDLDVLPPWPEEAALWFWNREAGPLRWIKGRPERADLGTAESFKKNILLQHRWDAEEPPRGAALIDPAKSPVLAYGRFHERRATGPVTLDCTSKRGTAGSRWGRRVVSWIKKRTILLQNMKKRCELILTDDETPATVVAFPEGMTLLRRKKFFWESGVKPIEKRPKKEKAAPQPTPPSPSRECVHLESVSKNPEERRLQMWWVFPPSAIRTSAPKFLEIAAEKLPAMLSARFKNLKGLHGTLRSRPEAFETIWKAAVASMDNSHLFWHCPQVSGSIAVKEEEPERRRKGIPFALLEIDADDTTLRKEPGLLKGLEGLFLAISEQLGAAYGVAQVLQNGERLPIHSRGTWTGIPRLHPWRTWFGRPYAKLVGESLEGSDVQRSSGGILLKMPGPPAPDADYCGRYPSLPDRILALGTMYYLEPAPFIPRLG